MRLKLTAALAVALGALGVGAPAASATFHLIDVREVYPGTLAAPNAEYVELQMWDSGQQFVARHVLHVYGPTGIETGRDVFSNDVQRGEDQSTLVLATAEATAQFAITADAAMSPSGQLDPSGGAVCWENLDCVSWGSFNGSLFSPAGTPAGAIPDGSALRRTIEPGCGTLLEAADDHNDSARDFFVAAPNPRPNSVAPTEAPCASPGPPPQPHPPQSILRRKPAKRTRDRTPTFSFLSSQKGSSFECALDRHRFRRCRSPFTARPLPPGRHRFAVRARNGDGEVDPSPASYGFRILPRR
jgi:hypothetical protein